MKAGIVALVVTALAVFATQAQARGHSGGSRPSYGGGKHTTSHGGHYQGGSGQSHRGGHYKNTGSRDQYGRHK